MHKKDCVNPFMIQITCTVCREAKIHDALLFFDECEAIFEDREKHGSNHVNMLLTEVEKHEGIIIMATNRFAISFATNKLNDLECESPRH